MISDYLSTKWRGGKRFISNLFHRIIYWRTVLTHDYDLFGKLKWLSIQVFDVIITGILLWYSIHFRTSDNLLARIVSYGLLSALALYYLREVVMIIKEKQMIKEQ